MSSDFKKMIEVLLEQRPEIDAEQIKEMINEKKKKIGAGYLTDQGALFLVGADLGVSFDNMQKSRSGIKDLYVGAKDVSVIGRILNIYPVKQFVRKDSNELVGTRTMTIYDKDSKVKVKLWDNHISAPDDMGLRPGDIIKITRAYVKSGLDNRPMINVGSGGSLEPVHEDVSIPDIESITMSIDDITAPQDNVVISASINSPPRISEFVNSRGEPSKSLQLQLSSESENRTLRAVIWNIDESKIPKVFGSGSKIRLVGVRVKQGNPQYGSGDLEIHGDEGTMLIFSESSSEIEVMPLKLISIGETTEKGITNCLGFDRSGHFMHIIVDSSLIDKDLRPENVIECVPSRIFGNSITLSKDDSYLRVVEDDGFPSISSLEAKIKDLKASEDPFIVEGIVLQTPNFTEVTTRTGQNVSVSDTLIGDDTGEIRLVGWRQQSATVNNLHVGDRIKILAAPVINGRDGRTEISLKSYSSIVNIS